MVRTSVAVAEVTAEEAKYEDIKTWRGLLGILNSFKRTRQTITSDPELDRICQEWFGEIGVNFDPIDIDSTIEMVRFQVSLEEEEIKLHEVKNEKEFESKQLSKFELEALLKEYEKHQDNLIEIKKNLLLANKSDSVLSQVIERKIQLQKEAENKGLSKIQADVVSDNEMVLAERLKEKGIETKRAEEIAKKAAYIPAMAVGSDDAGSKTQELFKYETVERKIIEEVLDQTLTATSELIVATKEEAVANEFVEKLKANDITHDEEKLKIIKEKVLIRLEDEIGKSIPKVAENKTKVIDGVETAPSLADEIIETIGVGDLNKGKINDIVRETQIETQKYVKEEAEAVEIYRRLVIEEEIAGELLTKGFDYKTVEKTAKNWSDIIYPKGMAGQMVKIDQGAEGIIENSYQARLKAELTYRLIVSPVSPEKNIKFLKETEVIEGNLKANRFQLAAKDLNENDIRSIKYIRDSVNFQKTLDRIMGRVEVGIGKTFGIKKLENHGNYVINRMNAIEWKENVANMASQFENLGSHAAFQRMGDGWLANGTINLFGWAGNLGGTWKNLTTKGNIGLKKLGINAASALKSLGKQALGKIGSALKTALMVAGGIPGKIAALLKVDELAKVLPWIVVGVIVGPLIFMMVLMGGPISSLVPTTGAGPGQNVNVGILDENGNPILPHGSGLPGGTVTGQCSVADVVTADPIRQCVVSAGNPDPNYMLKTGESVCNVGCGPTSLAMILMRLNSGYTPQYLYQTNSQLSDQTGGSYVYQDVAALRNALAALGKPNIGITNGGCRNAQDVANYICAGKLVLMAADFVQPNGSLAGHFFLATGVDGGIIKTMDPYPDYSRGKTNVFDGLGTPGSLIMGDSDFVCTVIDADKLR